MYKVDCAKKDVIELLNKVLVLDELLLRFDVEEKGNVTVLTIEKENQKIEYSVYGSDQIGKMTELLQKLKHILPIYLQDDVDIVIEEMKDSLNFESFH